MSQFLLSSLPDMNRSTAAAAIENTAITAASVHVESELCDTYTDGT